MARGSRGGALAKLPCGFVEMALCGRVYFGGRGVAEIFPESLVKIIDFHGSMWVWRCLRTFFFPAECFAETVAGAPDEHAHGGLRAPHRRGHRRVIEVLHQMERDGLGFPLGERVDEIDDLLAVV